MRKFYLFLYLFLFIGCSKSDKFHRLEWKVGQWVCYKINDEPLEVSIVDKDSTLFWIETVEPEIIVKALVEAGKINEPKRLIVQKIGESPMEFQASEFSAESRLPVLKTEDLGTREFLTLPCGKFKIVHIKEKEMDAWLSEAIPIFGIAKYKSKDVSIILQNYGLRGAKSKITKPVESVNL